MELNSALTACLARFDGIDLSDAGFAALMDAQERISDPDDKAAFAREFARRGCCR